MIAKKITIIKKKNLKKLGLKWDPGKKESRELMTKLEMTALAILLIILHRFWILPLLTNNFFLLLFELYI